MPRLIPRILRVNHAGEHGAVAIYAAQLAQARKRHPDLVPWLSETLSHEDARADSPSPLRRRGRGMRGANTSAHLASSRSPVAQHRGSFTPLTP
ncbi:demethoxyubiquinone hydroxylase family protein [Vitreimonas sp.]|uniref:demethoxyubiquinone hydroxylase family protein n=1 Tax=Vitreimonas sp. TaxID=3069702 RepID=UPI0039C9EAEE